MRYAIVESGGKQYKAVEGEAIEVDRLAAEQGKALSLERVLLVVDGDTFEVGTPIVSGVEVRTTVVDHFSGPKVDRFKYSPKKRIRVRGGHRQQYTRLMVEFIGGKGETRKQPAPSPAMEPAPAMTPAKPKKAAPKKDAAKKTPGGKPSTKKPAK